MSGLEPGPLVPTHRPTLLAPPPPATPSAVTPVRNGTFALDRYSCNRHLDLDYDVPTAVICGMYLLFGVVYSLFGYRCFKAVMFLTGFIFGSIIVYLICLQEKLLPAYGNVGVALGAGILFGLITMLVQYVGLFMTGFHTGLFTGAAILSALEEVRRGPGGTRGPGGSAWTAAGVLLGSGLLLAVLNLRWRKGLTVAGTAVYGGAIISTSLDYFVEKFAMVQWFWARVALKTNKSHYHNSQPPFQPCWFSWIILSVWPIVVIVGMVTQWAVTGRGIHHQEMIPSKKVRAGGAGGASGSGGGPGGASGGPQRMVRTREQRAEARQKKYRYLYQVRTAHGDVISQSYIQALQRKVCSPIIDPRSGSSLALGYGSDVGRGMGGSGGVRAGGGGIVIGGVVGCGPGETSTLQSDSTHLTILPAEQAQLAALTESDDNDSEDDSELEGRVGSRGVEEDDEYYYGVGGAHSSSEAVLRPIPSSHDDHHERRHSGRQRHSPSVGFGIPRPFR
ncbi:transmembrane protein 198 [Ischnura elegans]|uniref:transmembrane protein 198 n=1 Tax=Ischnura elegans TaxID=197161 RepID=UPI001ED88349|nr:transmembrane protein 198 [Ischnura elegans]XP_046396032.1 transmembrane protein 198 [Ischnura elegans]